MEQIYIDLGTKDIAGNFRVEVSADGQNWTAVPLTQEAEKTEIVGNIKTPGLSYIRLANNSGKELQVYFKKFTLRVQK